MRKSRNMTAIMLTLVLCLVFTVSDGTKAEAATVLTESREGRDGDYTYSLWKDYGDTSMTVNGDGKFECSWSNIGNALFREGIKFDCTKTYKEIGNITVEYGVDYNPNGNSYMCVYGWSRDPLIEYYIVDSWGSWRPPGAASKGQIEVDGGTYDIYETIRENQPSIDGNTTFKQYWSVRTSKRTKGTISVTEHFKAWEKLGLKLGKLYEACLTIEGYQSSGKAEVYLNKVTVGGKDSGNKDDGSKDDKTDSGKTATGSKEKYECESMSKSGPYAGNIYSPFSGAALYANGDTASVTVNFSTDIHDFILMGASNCANKARVDLVIGDKTVGSFYLTEKTSKHKLKNISHATGNQTVKLVVTTDDGTWDAYLDYLVIKNKSLPKVLTSAIEETVITLSELLKASVRYK